MSDKQVLLDAAALLVKLAAGTSPTTTNPHINEIIAGWERLIEQFKKSELPHEYRELAPGTPYWETGTNEKESPFYEKFKSFWMAMERLKVKDHSGQPFVYQEAIRRGSLNGPGGGNAEFEKAVKFLATTTQAERWFNDPLNANYLPKPQDMLLLR